MGFTLKPVTGKQLIGREDIVQTMLQELSNLRSDTDYAVYGLRRVGKTSVLRELERRLRAQKNIVPIYLSLWQIFPFTLKTFLEKLIVTILENYQVKLSLKHSISDLMKTPLAMLQKILESSKISATLRDELEFTLSFKIQPETDYSKLFEKAFTLPESLAKDTNTKCVLILDEFPSLLELKDGLSLVRAIRSIHEPQQKTVFCIASSVRKYMDAVAMSETSPFYKQLVMKEIRPLTETEVELLLEMNAKEYGMKIVKEGVQEMFRYTQGIPFYVQFLGKVAAEKQIDILNKEQVHRIVQIFLEEEGTTIFADYIKPFSSREQEIIKALAQGIETVSELSTAAKESSNVISTYLLQLIDKGVIERVERGKYCLTDPLFKEWLANR